MVLNESAGRGDILGMTAKEACKLTKVSEQELMKAAIASIEKDIS